MNITARIESLTKTYGLDNLVTMETVTGLSDPKYLEVDTVAVKGREAPITVCTLLNRVRRMNKADFLQLREDNTALLQAYRSADVAQGLAALARCQVVAKRVSRGALDDFYALYAARFKALQTGTVTEDWDGIYRPDEK